MPLRSRKTYAVAVSIAALALLVSGCSASGASGKSANTTLTMATGGVYTNNNSPFAPTSSALSGGWAYLIYEPAVQVDVSNTAVAPTPWLAKSYKWSPSYKTLTLTARSGVKWSDGKAFSAKDIAYTYNLLKRTPALNAGGFPYSGVSQKGDTVTINFSAPQFVNQLNILQQLILPQHIWKDIKDPATYVNPKPVGTGPFLLKSVAPSVAKLSKNPSYWQSDKVKVDNVVVRGFQGGNAPIINALAAHEVDTAGVKDQTVQTNFVDKNPKENFSWNANSLAIVGFWPNDSRAPFNNVHLREAMNDVIDREKILKLAGSGASVSDTLKNVTGMSQPVGDAYIASAYKGKNWKLSLSAAKTALAAGGFTLSGGVLKDSSGKPVKMVLQDPAEYTDYVTALQIIGSNLKQIGIATTIQSPSVASWNNSVATGDFDGIIHWTNLGATPYDMYTSVMSSMYYLPYGQAANGNFGRFKSSKVDAAFKTYASTSSTSARSAALATIQSVFVKQVPMIPIQPNGYTLDYTTAHFTGFPNAKNPYASPLGQNLSLIVTKLVPTK